ncbi:hypothetical protein ACFU9Y_34095 [Streptomyces sp. NPDC057621]|uniref:L,D-transpeptidase n=1 Tax=Streptomyces liliiviolaceus TaxID=2823109 RepID=A0A940XNM6_9ACTN|nr:hypothetical protein [Streptomyces liliiviolaceus]
MPVPARRLPSWAWVTGLTAAALVLVAVLAVKAGDGPQPTASASKKTNSPSASAKPSASPDESEPVAVPDGSGTGRRIVYSLGQKRVWLVDASDAPRRTFKVWQGTVSPDPGTYTVGTRRETATGSDGVEIENIVYFAVASGVNVAFSNALDGSSPPPPASGATTGGVRTKAADGDAVWKFGTAGTTVAVVK